MSHRQKNKHKSRHRIHANNGPRVPQIKRAAPGPAKTDATTTETVPTSTAVPVTPSPVAAD
ncbi:MAG: hypothetical protein H7145_01290 [Akkermansiaceae bacterium]|nr:hypothetical protein [Armatimonadota bacterium]